MRNIFSDTKKAKKIKNILLFFIIAFLFILPFTSIGGKDAMRVGFNIAIYAVLAQMWNLMCGYAGLLSLGQQLFIGVSGYAVAVVCTSLGLPFLLGLLLGGIISAFIAFLLSTILLRMRGMYFAVATWVIAEMVKILFTGWKVVNYGGGMVIRIKPYPTLNQQYLMALTLAVISLALVYYLLNAKIGLGLTAMRDDLDAAASIGVNIFVNKTLCFVICGFITGVAGGLAYINKISVYPNGAFSMEWTIAIVFAVVVGGIGTISGPIIGSVIYVLLFNFLSQYAGYSNLILGLIAIVVILIAPKGIVGTLENKFHFELLSSRRTLAD
jgi:branched-chain amino acid transport system permease protein